MFRNIIDVYLEINDIIPNEFNELKDELKIYIDSLWNKAPEVLISSSTYIPFGNILNKHISKIENNNQQWIYEISNIFEGKNNLIIRQ
jgi:hypothetical protein